MLALPCAPPPRNAVIIDFEFRADPGERPHIWCLVVREEPSGQETRYWRDDLLKMRQPPFDIGPNVAVIAYFASAEWGCFKQLRWSMPAQPIDLYAEVRVAFNRYLPKDLRKPGAGDRWGLYDALARYGLEAGESAHKAAMRKMAMSACEGSWTTQDQHALLDYCAEDVRHLAALYQVMRHQIDWPQARLRGLYTLAVAAIEHSGIPLDGPLFRRLQENWSIIKSHYVAELERHYGFAFHKDGSFNQKQFLEWTNKKNIVWPLTATGGPRLDDKTFEVMEEICRNSDTDIGPLRRIYSHILDLKMSSLPVGHDDRSRFLQSPFSTATGRTMPAAAKNIWAQARWIRPLIRPPEGYGLAVLDWKAQEYCITACESGDERMVAACLSGDPYKQFACDARLVEPGSEVSAQLRAQCKVVALGVTYGMTEHGAAAKLSIPEWQARRLIAQHMYAYRTCWRWLDDKLNAAQVHEIMVTKFGWKWRPVPYCTPSRYDPPSVRSIKNYHCQASGGDMLRIAAVLIWLAGIEIVHTMHDAVMIIAPLAWFDDAISTTRACMVEAGRAVAGFELSVDVSAVRWPGRYTDSGGQATWDRTMALLS